MKAIFEPFNIILKDKYIKYPDEIIPKLYCSRELFTDSMNPEWNSRKIVRFKFEYFVFQDGKIQRALENFDRLTNQRSHFSPVKKPDDLLKL